MINLLDKILVYFGTGPFFEDLLQFSGFFAELLANPDFPLWLIIIKYIFILITLFFLGLIIIVPITTGWLKLMYLNKFMEFFTFRPIGAVRAEKRWKDILSKVEEAGTESDYKISVMEAETMLIDVLEEMGYTGDTLEERLEQLSPGVLPNKKDVLKAHKIRNSIARDPDYEIDLDRAEEVLGIYEEAFRNLQAF